MLTQSCPRREAGKLDQLLTGGFSIQDVLVILFAKGMVWRPVFDVSRRIPNGFEAQELMATQEFRASYISDCERRKPIAPALKESFFFLP